jgi:hypothetical protein
MTWSDLLGITPYPGLSLLLLFLILSLVVYFSRTSLRAGLMHASLALYRACRIGSVSLKQAEQALQARNCEVLLEQGRQAAERAVEREFERIDHTVRKELGDYPALHRQVSEAITAIEEDYQRSREVPPAPHGWAEAVAAIAQIPKAEGMVTTMLESMYQSIQEMEERAINEYRKDSRERHRLLSKARHHWQELVRRLAGAETRLQRLLDRAGAIDNHMADYASINQGSDAALRRLSASSLTQFFVSSFVLAIAVGGAIINFNLIARPMSEMVGGTSTIGSMQVADIAALVIIMVEISMGLFLMESLRITRLFPVISALDDRLRVRMIWISLGILTSLALVEAGLAFMREILVQDELATASMLRGEELAVGPPPFMWITTAAQMGMGFILPFALTFVAIPLETFIHSLRTVLGMLTVAVIRVLATLLRIAGALFRGTGPFLAEVCDAVAFLPLWIEMRFRGQSADGGKSGKKNSDDDGVTGLWKSSLEQH